MANNLVHSQQIELMQILRHEIECMHSLMRSMEQEHTALAEHHTEILEDVILDKQETIQKLETVEKKRESLLMAMGADSSNINDLFKGNKQLSALWEELIVLAGKCQKKNRINGSIVDLVTHQSQHALNILQGISPGDELYDYSGQSRQFTESHSLTKA